MKPNFKSFLVVLALLASVPASLMAQAEVTVDLYNRYVWRGTDLGGGAASIQPGISYSIGGLTIGTWGAFATNANDEIDYYLSYTIETKAGEFGLAVTDYTLPVSSLGTYFEADAHPIEVSASFTASSIPISLLFGAFVLNEDDKSIYAEVGYTVGAFDLFLGSALGKSSVIYGTNKAGIVNTGFSTSKEIKVTDDFSLAFSTSLIVNPYAENAFLLFSA